MPAGNTPQSTQDSADFPALPTRKGIGRSLQWLRKTAPIAPEQVLDCFDLLSLPCVAHESDPTNRAVGVVSALPEAIKHVGDLLYRVILEETFDASAPGTVNTRIRAAKDRAARQGLIGADTSDKTLGDLELQAILHLADVLRSYSFAREFAGARVATESVETPDPHGFGYVWLSRSIRLKLHADDQQKQTYTRTIHLKATGDQTRVAVHRFYWTGGGSMPRPVVCSTEHGHSWLGTRQEDGQIGNWYATFFHLGQALAHDEDVELEWAEELVDTEAKFNPVLTIRARFPDMQFLRLELEAPHLRDLITVRSGAFRHDGSRLIPTGPQTTVDPTDEGVYRYVKKNPVQGFHYGLHWR